MKFRNLGNSGLLVSEVGLGCNNFEMRLDIEASRKVIHKALDLGITLFDTADIYGNRGGSETQMGKILGPRRKDIVLATKFGMPMDDEGRKVGASRRYIMQAVEDSLRRLQTDWIDLYQQHQPDPRTPIEETLRALDDLVRQGKVRYIGNSNFASWQLADADWTARQLGLNRFVSAQDELSLVFRKAEAEQLPACERFGLGFLPFFPLASGLLTGKHQGGKAAEGSRLANTQRLADRYMTPANLATVERLRGWCEKRGMSMVDLAFGWLLAKPQVSSVIAGATRPEQLEQNVKAGETKLSAEDLAEIAKLLEG
ncbi:MAG TPA: aldo/keto reductase [Ferrovibrio sp.]|uniref:aldo/keto reductase n=1 Tax=Ferrovibrio sp. TaxID=1917215 RepID=UPI002B4B723D|nr:aldo/keto reductase [Ferrovibrio sp.]HLT77651.1 aldo/keto reductase [Ferrovibrio sp.]